VLFVTRSAVRIATEMILCLRAARLLVFTVLQVNTQLYNAREKADLAHLVDVMIAYNLTYQQVRAPDGQYTYTIEP
jgi:hypothetical protein